MFFGRCLTRLGKAWSHLINLLVILGSIGSNAVAQSDLSPNGDKSVATTQHLVLKNHVPAIVKELQPVNGLDASRQLHLTIGLPLRDPTGLQQLLQQIYDPNSPSYRHYLTPDQLTEKFGPLPEHYEAVVDWAKSHNLVPTAEHPNRLLLEVVAPVSAIEAALHIKLHSYQHPTESRTFFAPDVDPTLDISAPVITVSGLSDFFVPRPHSKIQPVPAGVAAPKAGSGPSGTYAGNDFRAAYAPGVTLTGTGQSVALVEFDGYYTTDITTYESQFGLPSVTLSNIAVNGGVTNVGSGNSEVALDIEMAVAMAPGLSKIYVYEAPNDLANFEPMISRMQTDNLVKQIGCSWGGGSEDPTSENVFQLMAAQGQSFFNATGDSDAFIGDIPFPSDSPNITQVGATTLTTDSGGGFSSETVWNWGRVNRVYTGSSGGISTVFAIPVWQQGISMTASQGSTSFRNVPDVALTGDNVYVRYNNGTAGTFGGTSCAAPLWAAVAALMNQRAVNLGQASVGFINPAVYNIGKSASFTTCFHDTVTGNNFSRNSPSKFAAVTGYDLCTGWGTPSISNLMNALVVNQSAATKLSIQTQPPATATAGVAFAVHPVIRIEDSSGNLQTNDNSTVVTATRSAGAGTLQGTTNMTAVGGLVTFTNLSHRYATNITIAFTSGSLTAATSSVVAVSAGQISQVQILVPGQAPTPTVSPGRAGTALAHVSGSSFSVTVNAVDGFWNFVSSATDIISLSSSDGAVILPSNASLAGGTATLSVSLKTVGTQTLTASDVTHPGLLIDVSPGMSITPATLTVVASNASRTYGQTNPVFAGTLNGVQSGDGITATFNSSATTNSSKGSYTIVPSLNDPNNRLGNYTVLSTNGTLTVTAAPLSVTASNASRQYGLTNPVFGGDLVGLRNNDNIAPTFVSAATTNSTVGNYSITTTFSDPATKLTNYTVTTNNGTLTVTKAPLAVTAADASHPWGATNPVFGGTIVGLLDNDDITANYSTSAVTNSPVGTYPITFTLSDPGGKLSNYSTTTNNGTLTVFNNPPTISPIANQVAAVGSTLSFVVEANDPDEPFQNLSFSLDPSSEAFGASIDTNLGVFTWTPAQGTQGEGATLSVTVRVSDNAIPPQTVTATFNIFVIDHPALVDMQNSPDGFVSLTWNVYTGATYNFQFKNALSDATWSNLGQFTATNYLQTISDNPGGTQRFYRIASGSVVSAPAGFIPLTLLSNSDSFISIPFTRPIEASRSIISVASNVVNVPGPSWSEGEFVYSAGAQSNHYYARIDSGALEGRVYEVVTNGSYSLTLDLGADALDSIAPGDIVSVIPHWTLNSAFRNGDGVLASPSQGNRYTEIFIPDNTGTGINLSATKIYFFNNGIWKQVGQGSVDHGDDVLPLNAFFIARQNVATNSTMNALGAVVVSKLSLAVRGLAATPQDNSVGLMRASVVTLNNSGLIGSGAFAASPLPGTRTDELLTFDNSIAQKNKSSGAIYYYWNNAWRRVGAGSTDFGDASVFTPGAGFIIRKATNSASVVWTNAP